MFVILKGCKESRRAFWPRYPCSLGCQDCGALGMERNPRIPIEPRVTERFVRSQIRCSCRTGNDIETVYTLQFTAEVEIEIAGELIDCMLAPWGQYVSAHPEFKYLGQGRVPVMDSNGGN